MREPGRIHSRLVDMLLGEGFANVRISPAKGHWRSSPYADVVRWDGYATDKNGATEHLYSWHTMTACVRGLRVSERNQGTLGTGYEVIAL